MRHLLILCFSFVGLISFAQEHTVTSFSPTTATASVTVTIYGTNFQGNPAVSSVLFGGVPASSFTVLNQTTIIAIVSGGGATGSVSVVKGSSMVSRAGFTYFPPVPSASWPFSYLSKPSCSNPNTMPPNAGSCTKWPVKNNGDWKEGDTWNNGTVPTNMDIVCIPAGVKVIVKNPVYDPTSVCPVTNTAATPRLFIFVCGTIDFDASGKLHLGCQSAIQIWPGGTVLSSNGNSELIQIGTKVVWRDNNQNLPGPYYLNDGCQNSGCVGQGVLSVQFNSLKLVQSQPYKIDIEWSTSYEQQSARFAIERSNDQQSWETIGMVPARGNSQVIQHYTFTDNRPRTGINFYRVREINQSEQSLISDIARATIESKDEISLYPNPVKDQASIYCQGGFQNGTVIKVFNQNGAFVQQFRTGNADVFKWDIRDYKPGLYLLQIQDMNTMQVKTIKMVRQ
jgi:hypothetical protein